MKTLCLCVLPLALVSLVRGEVFDFTGSTITGLIHINGADVTGFNSTYPQTIGDDYPTAIDTNYSYPDFTAGFAVYDDTSTYRPFSTDIQGSLYLANMNMSTSFIVQAGSFFEVYFDFLSTDAQTITGFEFFTPSYRPELLDALAVQFDTSTSTLTITFTEDFTVLDMENLGIDGRFLASPVPEPASFAALLGFGALGAATLRRRRR